MNPSASRIIYRHGFLSTQVEQSSHNTSANFCADHSPTIDEEVPHTLGPKNTETAEPVNAGTEEEARCEVACGSMCGNFGLELTPGRNFGAEPDADSFKAFKTASRGAVEQS